MPAPIPRKAREALEDGAYLRQQIERGVALKDLAAVIGVGETALQCALRRHGIGPMRPGRRPDNRPAPVPHTGGIPGLVRRQRENDASSSLPPNRQFLLRRFVAVADAEKMADDPRSLFWALIDLAAASESWAQHLACEHWELRRVVDQHRLTAA